MAQITIERAGPDKWSPRRSLLVTIAASVLAWAVSILVTGLLFIGAFRLADWWLA